MAKVDEPRFLLSGQVSSCDQCPLNDLDLCGDWLDIHNGYCPTADTYAEACRMAEEVTHDAP